jgi:hypothetical protein
MNQLACRLTGAWNRFWFTPADPSTIAAIRIATGLILLYVHGAATPVLMDFIGPEALVDSQAIAQIRESEAIHPMPWGQSIWFLVQETPAIWFLHFGFLLAIIGFTVGFWTKTMNVLVCVGHLSFIHRAMLAWSGLDTILAMLTIYLVLAPSGAALSIDHWRQNDGSEPRTRWATGLVMRLIQLHMCIIYLAAGLGKLQGARWWDGTAVWNVMLMHEFAPIDMSWLGFLGDGPCHLTSNVGVVLTLGMEISFAFLIWNPRVRPVLLTLAVLMHGGIGLFMGMGAFGAAMLAGCLAFVPPETVRAFLAKCAARVPRRASSTSSPIPAPTPAPRRAA